MMRAWPRSLFARLALALAAVLVVAQLASLAIHFQDRAQVLYRAIGLPLATRIAETVKYLDAQPRRERRLTIVALRGDALLTRLVAAPPDVGDGGGWRGALLAALVRQSLDGPYEVRVTVSDRGARWLPADAPHEMHRPGRMPMHERMGRLGMPTDAQWIQVSVQLHDGQWTLFGRLLPRETFVSPWRMLLSLAVLLAAAIGAALFVVRSLTRPLERLGEAADRLGRDLNRPPLEEDGPREVASAARAFNTMQQRLARLVHDRTRMLASISHDLRTPMTRLRLRAEQLDDATQRERIESDLDDMERLVGATLDFLRETGSEEPVVPLDINALVDALQADYEDTGRRVAVRGRALAPYPGRIEALRRCLGNLVDNALRYGTSVVIELEDGDDELVIRVLDDGPGLSPEELERAFEPYHRGEPSRSRKTGGTGLGLAIARNIARLHGGDLTLHNRETHGLAARLSLPR